MFSGSKFSLLAKSILVLTLLVAPALAKRKHDKPKPIGCGELDSLREFTQIPYHIAIYDYNRFVCGGVMIDNRHILTAAQCVNKGMFDAPLPVKVHHGLEQIEVGRFKAIVGKLDIYSQIGHHSAIDRIIFHDEFNERDPRNDIAILRTEKHMPIVLDHLYDMNRVCLPLQHRNSTDKLYVSGWATSRCKNSVCAEPSRSKEVRLTELGVVESDACPRSGHGMFCAAVSKDSNPPEGLKYLVNNGAYMGDRGSGVVRLVDGRFELVGLVSYPRDDEECLKPTIYTKVEDYLDWINYWINKE